MSAPTPLGQFGDGSYLGASTPGGAGGAAFVEGGNAFGAEGVLGTLDNFDLVLYRNGAEVARFDVTRLLAAHDIEATRDLIAGRNQQIGAPGTSPVIGIASQDASGAQFWIRSEHGAQEALDISFNGSSGGAPVVPGTPVWRDLIKSGGPLWERDWLFTSGDGLTTVEALFLLFDTVTHTPTWGLCGNVAFYNTDHTISNLSLPNGSGAQTAILGQTGTSVSLASVEKIDITPGASSTWGPSSGTLSLQAAGGILLTSNLTVVGGVGVTAAAGGGAFTLGAMTGAWSMPTGDGGWSGASGKTLTMQAAGNGPVNIKVDTGALSVDATGNGASIGIGSTNSAINKTVTVGSNASGAATILQGQAGNTKIDWSAFGTLQMRSGSQGWDVTQVSTSAERWTGSGSVGGTTKFRWVSLVLNIGEDADKDDAVLALASTTRGFLPPRMTKTQRDAIASPTAGLVIYDTTNNAIEFYNGSAWRTCDAGPAL